MSKFDFRFLMAVMICLLYPESSIVCCDSEKKDKERIIKFKNGSILAVEHMPAKEITSQMPLTILHNKDGTVDYYFDEEKFNEVVNPFSAESFSNDNTRKRWMRWSRNFPTMIGVRPRKRSKNKLIQKILIRLFGYEVMD